MALRPTPANDERFARFALLDFDTTRGLDSGWFDAFSTYSLECAVRPSVKRTMKRLIKIGAKRIADDDLRRISSPVDLIWGASDRMVPLSLGTGASRRLGWPLHVISNAAHAPHIEQPDAFVHTVQSVLAGTAGPRGATPKALRNSVGSAVERIEVLSA
jgi:2-hydroxymuconate-semialdehyde hydrolase